MGLGVGEFQAAREACEGKTSVCLEGRGRASLSHRGSWGQLVDVDSFALVDGVITLCSSCHSDHPVSQPSTVWKMDCC